jgi:hypothetical protein
MAYLCKESDCAHGCGFATQNDLNRHQETVHNVWNYDIQSYPCFSTGFKGPEMVWPRKDNFKSHLRKCHPNKDGEGLKAIYADLWNENQEGFVREDVSTADSIAIKKREACLMKLTNLQEQCVSIVKSPTNYGTVCVSTFDTTLKQIESGIQDAEAMSFNQGVIGSPAHQKCLAVFSVLLEVRASTLVNSFANSLVVPPLDVATHGDQMRSTSRHRSMSSNTFAGVGATYRTACSDSGQLPTSDQPTRHNDEHIQLIPDSEYHAKIAEYRKDSAQKPLPPPARMSPDDDDDDESYGFRRGQYRLAGRRNEAWRAAIARVYNPFADAKAAGTGKVCADTSRSGGMSLRLCCTVEG